MSRGPLRHWSYGRGESALDRPSMFKYPVRNTFCVDAELIGQRTQALRAPLPIEHESRTCVPRLLYAGCPPAVVGGVGTVIEFAINSSPRPRLRPKIAQIVFKAPWPTPPIANANAPATVMLIGRRILIVAPGYHASVGDVPVSAGEAVRLVRCSKISLQAAAAFRGSPEQNARLHIRAPAARAFARPHRDVLSLRADVVSASRHYRKPTERLSSEIPKRAAHASSVQRLAQRTAFYWNAMQLPNVETLE